MLSLLPIAPVVCEGQQTSQDPKRTGYFRSHPRVGTGSREPEGLTRIRPSLKFMYQPQMHLTD